MCQKRRHAAQDTEAQQSHERTLGEVELDHPHACARHGEGAAGDDRGALTDRMPAVRAFLADRFSLSCPEIAQYVFTSHLDDTLRCVREKRPELVLVTAKFRPIAGAPASWSQFVADGSSLLRSDYERVASSRTINGSATVWALSGSSAAVPAG